MRKILLITILLLSQSYFCSAQQGDEDGKVNTVRIAYFTEQLQLTSSEAQKFWPIYNKYKSEVKQARANRNDDIVKSREDVVNIQKKYKADFKEVLGSDERVNKMYITEAKFLAMLKDELNNRGGKKG